MNTDTRSLLPIVAAAWLLVALMVPAVTNAQVASPPVTLREDAETYTLDNGVVAARVAKASGDLVSLRFKDLEMLATLMTTNSAPDLQRDPPGYNPNGLNRGFTDHQYGFWSHDAMGPADTQPAIASVTIDPKSNGGARAEVSIKGISNGRKMGTGPGARAEGQFVSDIEIRYTLGRGESGVYTYSVFEHKPEYPLTSLGEARFCAKLNEFFDWMSASDSPHRNKYYPKDLREGDKYIYTVVQWENPAFGWSSTTKNVGFYVLNASMEYMSGGPTKVEFQGHRDTNPTGAPCVLNYWRSSHYGGAEVNVSEGEHWTKVVGPFLLYVNSGPNPQAMFNNAKAQQEKEAAAWPYDWVEGVDYPRAHDRASVKGRLALNDPPMPGAKSSKLMVGLTAPEYVSPRPPGPNPAPTVNWQRDAKHYQFWVRAEDSGSFEIPKVRPGNYTLHAFADGVLGEFTKADVTIESGETLDLGTVDWKPVRGGRQIWEIGIPNRNGSEFFKGSVYYEPDISLQYAQLFPDDIHYVVGKSDFRKDWFFQHVPHNEDPEARPRPFFGVRANGRATPFAINFDLPEPPRGRATLRLAICGTGTRSIEVMVNDQPAGQIEHLRGDGTIARHGIQGIWYERDLTFDAALMKQGENVLTLIVPAGSVNNGIIYDYVRLEIDESAQ